MELFHTPVQKPVPHFCNSGCNFRTLFRFRITENRMDGDKFIINGHHEQVSQISDSLQKRFLENGMPQEVLDRLAKGGAV